VKNWREYDRALVQRGSITFWLCDDFEKSWLYVGEKQRGSQYDYSEQAVFVNRKRAHFNIENGPTWG
jgi:hypothetical protein